MGIDNGNFSQCDIPSYHTEIKPIFPKLRSPEVKGDIFSIQETGYKFVIPKDQRDWFLENNHHFSGEIKESFDESISFLQKLIQGTAFQDRLEKYLTQTCGEQDITPIIELISDSLKRGIKIYLLPEHSKRGRILGQYAPHLSDKDIYYGNNPHVDWNKGELTSISIHELSHAIDDNGEISLKYSKWIREFLGPRYITEEVFAVMYQVRFALYMELGESILNQEIQEVDISRVLSRGLDNHNPKLSKIFYELL